MTFNGTSCRQYIDVFVMDLVGSCTQVDVFLCLDIFTALLAAYTFLSVCWVSLPFLTVLVGR